MHQAVVDAVLREAADRPIPWAVGSGSLVLGTSSVVEGTDLRHVREVHLLEPWWNAGRTEQVVGRAVRHGSHALLPEASRNVTVFHHACELPAITPEGRTREGADHAVIRRALAKRRNVAAALKVLREEAVDCAFHRDTYVRVPDKSRVEELVTSQGEVVKWSPGDRDGSRACMYGPCPRDGAVRCAGPGGGGTLLAARDGTAAVDDVEAVHARLEVALSDSTTGRLTGDQTLSVLGPKGLGLSERHAHSALDEIASDRWTLIVGGRSGTIVRDSSAEDGGLVAFVPDDREGNWLAEARAPAQPGAGPVWVPFPSDHKGP